MGKARKTRKFAVMRRMVLNRNIPSVTAAKAKEAETKQNQVKIRHVEKIPAHMFFKHNMALGPPYRIIIDTNFINAILQNKLELVSAMMDCLLAKCIPCVTDCVMAELEKLGTKYRLALRIAKDPRFERLACTHRGVYADDCIVQRSQAHKCYIVATCDRDLRRRLRKIPGVPIMFIQQRKCTIERMPDAYGAPR